MKCNVPDCKNEHWQGKFTGNLCNPCHAWIAEHLDYLKAHPNRSQIYINEVNEYVEYLKSAELCDITEKWNQEKVK